MISQIRRNGQFPPVQRCIAQPVNAFLRLNLQRDEVSSPGQLTNTFASVIFTPFSSKPTQECNRNSKNCAGASRLPRGKLARAARYTNWSGITGRFLHLCPLQPRCQHLHKTQRHQIRRPREKETQEHTSRFSAKCNPPFSR